MTAPAPPAASPAAPPAAPPAAARLLLEPPKGWLRRAADRLSEHLNPILVREVRQALNSRAFAITGLLALVATVLIGLGVAWDGPQAAGKGRDVFVVSLQVLLPILLFIVPFQAFVSMRHEVTQGTVEHLLMSRLRPGQIIRGKLGAAVVQFVLYLSIFAPLLTMTFLLRGVDVPTIAYLIVMAFLFGVAACSIAVACGALSRWPNVFRVLPFIVVVVGLGGATWGLAVALEFLARGISSQIFDERFWWASTFILLGVAMGAFLFYLVGTAMLAHPYENRSTAFRLFAWIGTILGFAWLLFMSTRPGMGRGFDATVLWGYAFSLAPSLVLFPLFAATEDLPLSPRVRTRVPRNRLLALLAAPFLPGATRGLLFTLLLAATAVGGAAILVSLSLVPSGRPPYAAGIQVSAYLSWLTVLFYCGVGTFVRSRLGRGPKATWIARGIPLLLLLLAIVVPLLVEALAGGAHRREWKAYQLLNPFETVDVHVSPGVQRFQLTGLGIATGVVLLLLGGRGMVRGVREVLVASRERRRARAERRRAA